MVLPEVPQLFGFTPVGWVAALTIGAAGAIASYSAGKSAKAFYNSVENKYDFIDNLKLGSVCQ